MQTKIILHGGFASHSNEENDKFFSEILNTEKKRLYVLLVYFAKNIDQYDEIEIKDMAQFNKNKGDRELFFEIANENNFVEQTKAADVIYLRGGKTLKLLESLKRFPVKELFKGKVVAGESAGAYVLSSYFYSKSEKGCFEGLKFVPVKTICHYIGENSEKLDDCPNGLEKLLLADYKYKVFYS